MKKLILLFCALGIALSSWAYDFTANGIYYNITDAKTVAVTYATTSYNSYSGAVSIPDSVTNAATGIKYSVDSIGNNAFNGCLSLTAITIASSVTSIGNYAFSSCLGLAAIAIPSSVTAIGNGAFFACANLKSIPIPSSLTALGSYVFANCTTLVSITIPSSITSIGNEAFENCTGLADIYAYPTTPVGLAYSSYAFYNVDTTKCTLHVPSGSLDAYKEANVWKGFTNISNDLNTTTGKTEVATSAVKVTVINGQAVITGAEAGTTLNIYNLQGLAIYTGKTSGEPQNIPLPAHGVYIVQLGGKSVKVIY